MLHFFITIMFILNCYSAFACDVIDTYRYSDVKQFIEQLNGIDIPNDIAVCVDKTIKPLGFYSAHDKKIVLKSFKKNVLAHEFGHVVIRECFKGIIPKEFDEHFAQYNEVKWLRR